MMQIILFVIVLILVLTFFLIPGATIVFVFALIFGIKFNDPSQFFVYSSIVTFIILGILYVKSNFDHIKTGIIYFTISLLTLIIILILEFGYNVKMKGESVLKVKTKQEMPIQKKEIYGAINVETAIIRSGPSKDYSIVGKAKYGEKITIIQELNGWLYVKYGTQKGYIFSKLVQY
jgi:predicted membrane protein